MPLGTFTKMKKRALPIFFLLDTSRSMSWYGASPRDKSLSQNKITTLNKSLKKMIAALKKVTENTIKKNVYYKVCFISFDKEQAIVNPKQPEDVRNIDFKPFTAKGGTPFKSMLKQLSVLLDSVDRIDYAPTVILLSDGRPSDYDGPSEGNKKPTLKDYLNWAPIKGIYEKKISSSTNFIAVSVGEESKDFVLAFLNNKEDNFIKADNAEDIVKYFDYITLSLTTRALGNPNIICSIKKKESDVIV